MSSVLPHTADRANREPRSTSTTQNQAGRQRWRSIQSCGIAIDAVLFQQNSVRHVYPRRAQI